MNEKWVNVAGFKGIYKVSNYGNVKSENRVVGCGSGTIERKGRTLKPQINNKGYGIVILKSKKYNKRRRVLVHRLVAEGFIPNPNNLPFVNHMDCDPLNNKASNLEWITNRDNIHHAIRNGRFNESFAMTNEKFKEDREGKMRAVIGTCVKTNKKVYFESIQEAGRNFNNSAGDICNVCKGNRKTARGYRWEYANDGRD